MRTKLNKIVSVILLMVFLFPTIVKLEHHHKYNSVNVKDERHLPVLKENCAICNFALPVFIPDLENINIQAVNFIIGYINNYQSPTLFNHTQFTFSFRAPPEDR